MAYLFYLLINLFNALDYVTPPYFNQIYVGCSVFLGAAPAAFQALGRAVSGLAIRSALHKNAAHFCSVCGCAAPFSIPHPLIIGPSLWLFLRPSFPFFKAEKGLLAIFFAKTPTFYHYFD